jgi:hypothetical protein
MNNPQGTAPVPVHDPTPDCQRLFGTRLRGVTS